MAKEKILLIDDERDMLIGCQRFLEAAGYAVVSADSGEDGLALFETESPDVVVLDLKMPGMDGMAVLHHILVRDPDAVVIILTGFGSIEAAVDAIKAGAFDFVEKPYNRDGFVLAVKRGLQARRVRVEHRAMRHQLARQFRFEHMVGHSAAMMGVFGLIQSVSETDAHVLITGESGTGKELVARCVHAHSRRSEKAFVPLNCGGMPEPLVESELFGHVQGAFTDAKQDRRGLIEHARGGTFFLDEVGELPMSAQVKFLRVLEDHNIRRIGSNQEVEVDIRLISATNQNLEARIRSGGFREDLYYRLNTVEIHLPALRERPEDIPLLAHHFLGHFAEGSEKVIEGISGEAMGVLCGYAWPGNVRELMHVMERAVILTDRDEIQAEDLPENVVGHTDDDSVQIDVPFQEAKDAVVEEFEQAYRGDYIGSIRIDVPFQEAKDAVVEEFEQAYLDRLLKAHDGNVSRASKQSGMGRRTLHRLIAKYAIDVSTYRR